MRSSSFLFCFISCNSVIVDHTKDLKETKRCWKIQSTRILRRLCLFFWNWLSKQWTNKICSKHSTKANYFRGQCLWRMTSPWISSEDICLINKWPIIQEIKDYEISKNTSCILLLIIYTFTYRVIRSSLVIAINN